MSMSVMRASDPTQCRVYTLCVSLSDAIVSHLVSSRRLQLSARRDTRKVADFSRRLIAAYRAIQPARPPSGRPDSQAPAEASKQRATHLMHSGTHLRAFRLSSNLAGSLACPPGKIHLERSIFCSRKISTRVQGSDSRMFASDREETRFAEALDLVSLRAGRLVRHL